MSEAPKTKPHAEPIYLASVYECESPAAADAMLGGTMPGYVYSRDGHPNAASLAEQCRVLHQAERAAVTNSGWVMVSSGSTTARVGRSRGWLITVFT